MTGSAVVSKDGPQGRPSPSFETRAAPAPQDEARLISRLLLVFWDGIHMGHPAPRRAEPALLLRRELIALLQDADPHHVRRLLAFTRRGSIAPRAAFRGA